MARRNNKSSGGLVVSSIGSAVRSAWPDALARAKRAEGDTIEEKVLHVRRQFEKELAMTGAAAGVVAASPGIGTLGGVAVSGTQIAHATKRSVELILTIGAIHGHTRADLERRQAWVLAVLSFGDSAAAGFAKFAAEASRGLGLKATKALPVTAIRAMNRRMASTIITKYGASRGALALGRVLPFGIGAVIGGGSSYAITRAVGRNAHKFFVEIPPNLSDGPIIDVSLADPPPPGPRPSLPPPPSPN